MKLKFTQEDSGWWVAVVDGFHGYGDSKVEALEDALKIVVFRIDTKVARAKPAGQTTQPGVLYLEGDLFDKFLLTDRSVKALARVLVKNHDRSAPTGEA